MNQEGQLIRKAFEKYADVYAGENDDHNISFEKFKKLLIDISNKNSIINSLHYSISMNKTDVGNIGDVISFKD
ncbi:hypothetical protein [Tenacibaculum soleae]|uniref:hypothetical protein n=1 Tax=Tenacibaculum soleae TaxID=447689 RepID=UPI0023000D96|nr:hypothetical protein [Tenacibaculum soleae]